MSPDGNVRGKKAAAPSSIYTALLALALGAVCGTAVLVVFKAIADYDTILKIVQVGR